jgi:hypothetical protein
MIGGFGGIAKPKLIVVLIILLRLRHLLLEEDTVCLSVDLLPLKHTMWGGLIRFYVKKFIVDQKCRSVRKMIFESREALKSSGLI